MLPRVIPLESIYNKESVPHEHIEPTIYSSNISKCLYLKTFDCTEIYMFTNWNKFKFYFFPFIVFFFFFFFF